MKIQSVFFVINVILSSILISCNNKEDKPKSPPEIEKIDPKTYSTSKDIWVADTKATCNGKEYSTDPDLTYGIDLAENYYWEVNKTTTNESICYKRHLYAIAVTNQHSQNSNHPASTPTYNITGVLIPQLLRIKCVNEKTNSVISDTGNIEDKSEENRIIKVYAFKSNLVLVFEKSPLCLEGQLVLSLFKQKY